MSCCLLPELSTFFENDFTFIVQRQKYHCSKVSAICLSGKVAKLFESNPNAANCVVRHQDPHCEFETINRLLHGGTVDLTAPAVNLDTLIEIARELEMDALIASIRDIIWAKESITSENVFTRVVSKRKEGLSLDPEAEFIAKEFQSLILDQAPENTNKFFDLGLEFCSDVLHHEALSCEDYDALLEQISERGIDYHPLLQFVNFEQVTGAAMAKFVPLLSPENITNEIWAALCRRCVHAVNLQDDKETVCTSKKGRTFEFTGTMFDGIIRYLTSVHGGNLHDRGVVTVTGSQTHTIFSSCHLKYLLNVQNDSEFYCSVNLPDWPHFKLDFHDMRVCPTSYSLGTYVFGTGDQHLKSWVIEGSVDDDSWVELDKRDNDTNLNGQFRKYHYEMQSPNKRSFRYIRLRMTGPSHRNDHQLLCSSIELYGALIE